MADIAKVTGAIVHAIDADKKWIIPVVAAETVANGQAGYLASTGKYGIADANAAGKQQFRGIFVEAAGAGQGTSLIQRGRVGGYDLSGLAYNALVYLSDTAGALADAAGTMSVVVGRVVPMSDADFTKVLAVEVNWLANWS
jgi:hypothetical protein